MSKEKVKAKVEPGIKKMERTEFEGIMIKKSFLLSLNLSLREVL